MIKLCTDQSEVSALPAVSDNQVSILTILHKCLVNLFKIFIRKVIFLGNLSFYFLKLCVCACVCVCFH